MRHGRSRNYDGRALSLVLVVPAGVALLVMLPSFVLFWLLAPRHMTATLLLSSALVGVPAVVGVRARRRARQQDAAAACPVAHARPPRRPGARIAP